MARDISAASTAAAATAASGNEQDELTDADDADGDDEAVLRRGESQAYGGGADEEDIARENSMIVTVQRSAHSRRPEKPETSVVAPDRGWRLVLLLHEQQQHVSQEPCTRALSTAGYAVPHLRTWLFAAVWCSFGSMVDRLKAGSAHSLCTHARMHARPSQ